MPVVRNVNQNTRGGYYDDGKPFSPSKWAAILDQYEKEVEDHGKCTIRRLADRACISYCSARFSIANVILIVAMAAFHGHFSITYLITNGNHPVWHNNCRPFPVSLPTTPRNEDERLHKQIA